MASGDSDDETDEFTLDAAAVVAEEAVGRKEARRVKPRLSEWWHVARKQRVVARTTRRSRCVQGGFCKGP